MTPSELKSALHFDKIDQLKGFVDNGEFVGVQAREGHTVKQALIGGASRDTIVKVVDLSSHGWDAAINAVDRMVVDCGLKEIGATEKQIVADQTADVFGTVWSLKNRGISPIATLE